MFSEQHKARIAESQRRAWQTKRAKAVVGEYRIIRGKERVRCKSARGWLYWKIVRVPKPVKPRGKVGCPIGHKRSLATRIKQSVSARRYLFDVRAISKEQKERIRKSLIYRIWREAVFERDDYTCQKCGDRSGCGHEVKLEAHHKKSFSKFPLLRFEVTNGETLCVKCHKKVSKRQMQGNRNGRHRESSGITQTTMPL